MNRLNGVLVIAGGLLLSACGAADPSGQGDEVESVATTSANLTFQERWDVCANDQRVLAGLVTQQVCVGADLFFRETFDGNGRTCGTCHRVANNYTIDPAFIATLPATDPVFVAEFDPNLATLENMTQLRGSALFHENVDGLEDPDNKFVLRSSQHTLALNVSTTRPFFTSDNQSPPEERTGWSGDGAPGQGRLKDFPTGAVIQHLPKTINRVAGVDFRLPTEDELNAMLAFEKSIGRMNDLNLANITFTDSGASQGKGIFGNVTIGPDGTAPGGCPRCHGGAGANERNFNTNRNGNTGVESSRSTTVSSFPKDGGFNTGPTNTDGSFGNGTFNTPPLIEAADTGPFFHTDTLVTGASGNNAAIANTIEQAIAFYDTPAFNNSPAAAQGKINQTANQIQVVGRFLRAINASMNVQMTLKRLDGAKVLATNFGDTDTSVQVALLQLAREELDDAVTVLAGAQGTTTLNATVQTNLGLARTAINDAMAATSSSTRITKIDEAISKCNSAVSGIGTGMTFTMGEGTLMF